jgi:hypothetical protein
MKTKTEELVEAILMIGARRGRGIDNAGYDEIYPLIKQHVVSLSKRVDELLLERIKENPTNSKLDLKKMSQQIDDILAKETPESLNKWLLEQRAKFLNNSESTTVDSELTIADYEESFESHRKLVKELDTIINGDDCAEQASLCDIVIQLRGKKITIE